MTDIAAIARERAVNCEVRKIAYRQSKDGIVVSFVVHPNEVPAGLATSQLGTRYILALVELDDEDMPKEVMPNTRLARPQHTEHKNVPASEDSTTPARARKSWHEMPLSAQAGMLSDDPSFKQFVFEQFSAYREFTVPEMVRHYCDVKSRKDILPDADSGRKWKRLVGYYREWQAGVFEVPA